MCSQDGDVPLLAQTVAGNASDKKLFRERLESLKGQIQEGEEGEDSYFVADSALYVEETLKKVSPITIDHKGPRKTNISKRMNLGIKRAKDFGTWL